VSPGCAHCYAESFAERWRGIPDHAYEQGFDLRLWPSRLAHPFRWKKPRVIFVNSMSDMFHEDVPADFIAEVFDVMARADHHIYQVLTKRHERMAELAPDLPWPPHVWMGVTIENRRFVQRADYLRQVPAAVRFISAEPLLGFLERLDLTDINWVITGGESGPKHRPVKAEWIRDVRDKCEREGVAFFFKQWGGNRAKSGGREFDGREYNAMPPHEMSMALAPTGPPRRRDRQRDLPDDADDKWIYDEHMAAKHEILRRYLGAWLPILGRRKKGSTFQHQRLVLVDGFAGRGRYTNKDESSPRIMFDRSAEAVDAGTAKEVWIRCAELNANNYNDHLVEVCSELDHEHVTAKATQESFEDVGTRVAEWAEKQEPPAPIFVFVDPFGVRGVPLDLLRCLLAIHRVEVLLTFMVRDPARFLKEPNYEKPMTALFGGDAWKACEDSSNRPDCLMRTFREIVTPDVAQFALAFRVFEDEKRTTLYYLIHLTNKPRGMREMKKAMVKKSGDMTFWPVTVRDPNQIELEVGEQKPYPSLIRRLHEEYAGQSMTFEELINRDYPHGTWLDGAYKEALKAMAKEEPPVVTIDRHGRKTSTGKEPTGINEDDGLTFSA